MAAVQPVRGTHDLMPDEARLHARVAETARSIVERFGYQPIATPIFEFTEVFQRSLGETTDVVTKEMYTFTDRSGDSLTLRPENTAGVARAFITNGLAQETPCRLFYYGPMFRHERPQKGRLRQFHQIGIELLGVDAPLGDVETIAAGHMLLDALGIADKITLEVNWLGDAMSRSAWRGALTRYFSAHADKLSEDSRSRLDRNPLRILDSKDPGDRELVAGAPPFVEHMTDTARDFRSAVEAGLNALGIPYVVNPLLVRGLDYYCHTAFEFITTALGAQGTVMGGGRYDGLIQSMGGPAVSGVGWAAGVERLAMLLGAPPPPPRAVAMVPVGTRAETEALRLAHALRQAGIPVDMGFSGNLGKRMKRADKIGARAAVILGDTELDQGIAAVRDLDAGTQEAVPLASLVAKLAGMGQNPKP